MVDCWSLEIRVCEQSGTPVPMAIISINSTLGVVADIAAQTALDGTVSITVPCGGEYLVSVYAVDFEPVIQTIECVKEGGVTDIVLHHVAS